ncbi:MAG TPA: alpha-1,4-glucan--maltose-1-phosphate maltosyltransferase [Methylovirgula sp.]|nr:alpha-1,4-glucan--maltose-1-phosphate maltosyltransferase [Methylovirgula sp.]
MRMKDRVIRGRSICYVPPLARRLDWQACCARARELGFDHVAIAPPFAPGPYGNPFLAGDLSIAQADLSADLATRSLEETISRLVEICQANELGLLLDVVADRVDANGAIARAYRDVFEEAAAGTLDPRAERQLFGAALARFDRPEQADRLGALWTDRLRTLLDLGVAGFRFLYPTTLPAWLWSSLIGALRTSAPELIALAFTPGSVWRSVEMLAPVGFDGVFSSLAWWDRHANWFVEELELLRGIAPIIACPEILPIGGRELSRDLRHFCQMLDIAAVTADALMIPIKFAEAPELVLLEKPIRMSIARLEQVLSKRTTGAIRPLSDAGESVTALIRHDGAYPGDSKRACITLINTDLGQERATGMSLDPLPPAAGAPLGRPSALERTRDVFAPLAPGEVRLVEVQKLPSIKRRQHARDLARAVEAPRIVIEKLAPAVDGGAFPTKRLSGEPVVAEADIFADGHSVIDADLLWKAGDEPEWQRVPMRLRENDRWRAAFTPGRIGPFSFTIEAWIDDFGGLRHDIDVKRQAGADFSLEVEEAKNLVASAAAEAPDDSPVRDVHNRLARANAENAVDLILAPEAASAMRQAGARSSLTRHPAAIPVEVERPQAGFAAWYELFPRSASPIAGRHGTFDDVIGRLPNIAAMGFDVLYLPPIHPIGRTNRKGRNNALTAHADDPGSPYAIGAEEGGHDAIHPELGSFGDFQRLIAAADDHGIELSLDFAIQCSPDHPWLKEHPGWFRWRADGSLRFAENPPKKYEDIVNVDFYGEDAKHLWTALRDIVLFWIDHGIRIFRVDNPHTKPLPFWEWLIGEVRARHPKAIFLSEAFTRPKMMYRLAKIGFSQSYTYFTWRNSKQELIDYLRELTSEPAVDFFRPHFFVNTPDINPFYLQHSGRAGFLIRAALAATLSGLWGIYSGFELCEAAALPGREEYLDAEKYELKHRDFGAPGNITAEIAMLNRLRRAHPALQSHKGLKFYNAYNDQVLAYGKPSATGADMIFVAVNLDPHHAQEATFEVPLWEWGLPDSGSVLVENLLQDGARTVWQGKLQSVRLDPASLPYAIWRIAPLAGGRA